MSFRTNTTLPDNTPPDPVAPLAATPHSVTPESGARSYAFPRSRRVTRGPEIEQVRQEGKRVRTASMDVRAVASLSVSAVASLGVSAYGASANGARGRVGIIVPKYGHSSVDRNRVKRRLRELVRLHVLPVLPSVDVVLRVAPRAYTRSFEELHEEVRKWSQQLVTGRAAR